MPVMVIHIPVILPVLPIIPGIFPRPALPVSVATMLLLVFIPVPSLPPNLKFVLLVVVILIWESATLVVILPLSSNAGVKTILPGAVIPTLMVLQIVLPVVSPQLSA